MKNVFLNIVCALLIMAPCDFKHVSDVEKAASNLHVEWFKDERWPNTFINEQLESEKYDNRAKNLFEQRRKAF